MNKKQINSGLTSNNDNGESKKLSKDFIPIVGIGASAGGLEAFSKLLNKLPEDTGLAFVLVQHLSPDYESILPELLTKETNMPVHLVKDGIKVKVNNFYVIPPNKDIILKDGTLILKERSKAQGVHMPIDTFLRSLAEIQKSKSIGVILSGTGTDGTLGIRAIKAAGGLTFAQNVESAKYDGMPRSAIASGEVDFILKPDDIADELSRVSKHPYVAHKEEKENEEEEQILSDDSKTLDQIFSILKKATNIDFTHYKLNTIKRRIARRMVLKKIEDISKYIKLLNSDSEEVMALYNDMLINVTNFFREPVSFEVLKEIVLPKVLEHKSEVWPLRIWVPGCSTGEEVYSLTISLIEFLGNNAFKTPVQVFGTDISELAIDKAREGFYHDNIKQDVSPERLQRFFVKINGGYQINKTVRNLCVFAKQNVIKDPPFSKMDIISCRNLLIYLSPVLQKKVLPTFHYALNPNGYLMLGSSESIGKFSDLFYLTDKRHKIYQKKQANHNLDFTFTFEKYSEKTEHIKSASLSAPSIFEIEKEADKIIMSKFAPASILVNEDMNILQFHGNTGIFLEPLNGPARLNLFKMAKESLLFDLRAAIHKSKKENIPIVRRNIKFDYNTNTKIIDLEVIPIKAYKSGERYFLILFHDKDIKGRTNIMEEINKDNEVEITSNTKELEEELKATKEYLESIIEQKETINEELRSALEELQSSNEELQSTNEEMETAKEELQSTNEELSTINDELESKNGELNLLNSDLINLLSSINIPIIMLGNDLRIRRYTPTAEKVFNIISSDVGRPISDLRLNINVPNLNDILLDVLSSLQTKEVQVQGNNSNWFSMSIRPYRTIDNKIDGVVIAFLDIHYMKKSLTDNEEALKFAQSIINNLNEPLVILYPDLKIRFANESFYNEFKLEASKVEGEHLYNLLDGKWSEEKLLKQLNNVIKKNQTLNNFEFQTSLNDDKKVKINLNARRIHAPEVFPNFILLTMESTNGK